MGEPESAGKVLVVDDTEANRYTVVRLLRKAGFTVYEAADGRRGLDAVNADLDLIILDIRMPELDGYEVCRRLKADPTLKAVPILHMSATFTEGTDIAYGLEGGADGYLVHPWTRRSSGSAAPIAPSGRANRRHWREPRSSKPLWRRHPRPS